MILKLGCSPIMLYMVVSIVSVLPMPINRCAEQLYYLLALDKSLHMLVPSELPKLTVQTTSSFVQIIQDIHYTLQSEDPREAPKIPAAALKDKAAFRTYMLSFTQILDATGQIINQKPTEAELSASGQDIGTIEQSIDAAWDKISSAKYKAIMNLPHPTKNLTQYQIREIHTVVENDTFNQQTIERIGLDEETAESVTTGQTDFRPMYSKQDAELLAQLRAIAQEYYKTNPKQPHRALTKDQRKFLTELNSFSAEDKGYTKTFNTLQFDKELLRAIKKAYYGMISADTIISLGYNFEDHELLIHYASYLYPFVEHRTI